MQRLIMIWMTALILQVGIDAQGGDEEGPQGDSRGFETQTFPSQNLADGDDGTGNGLIPDGVSARANVLPDPTPPAVVQYINPDIEPLRRPQYRGKYYRALVPATLDLAERARLAVNALTETVNKNSHGIPYMQVEHMADPPSMTHTVCDLQVVGKYFAYLPLVRSASGSSQNMDVEYDFMKMMLRMQGEDGLLYSPTQGWPWVLQRHPGVGLPADSAGVDQVCTLGYGTARALSGFMIYAQKDPTGPWAAAARRLVEGFKKTINIRGDIAYTFDEWTAPGREVRREAEPLIGIKGGAMPWISKAFIQYDRIMGGDPDAVEIAEKIVHWVMGDMNYFTEDGRFQEDSPPNGSWCHFHTHTMDILGTLYVVERTGNQHLLDRATKAYRYALTAGEPLVGYYPENVHEDGPEYWAQHPVGFATCESCEVGDMLMIGVMFSRLGIDKWDDVDRCVRNQFAENQMTHTDWLTDGNLDRSKSRGGKAAEPYYKGYYELTRQNIEEGKTTTDDVVKRSLGTFACWAKANDFVGHPEGVITVAACCTVNSSRALYFVWRNMVSYEEGKLTVNLLLNRASRWADVESHIPYTGQVDVKARQKLELAIRIPEWVEPDEVRCTVNGKSRSLTFEGRYAQVGRVRKGQTAVMTFPIFDRKDTVDIQGVDYTLVRRGNTVVSIDPPGRYYPYYRRAHYRGGDTLYREVTRFIPDQEFEWY